MLDTVRSKFYYKKKKILMKYGFEHRLIGGYGDWFIERARNVYYGGIPASILLLTLDRCNHRCFDRSVLAACCLDDMNFRVVGGDIDGIKLHPGTLKEIKEAKAQGVEINKSYGRHSFVIFEMEGTEWVIDTTDGLIYWKPLYYLIENVKERKVNDKAATQAFPDYIDIKEADINRDKYALPSMLPVYEKLAENEMYKERLLKEIELFKKTVGYDEICEEILADKRSRGWNV